MSEDFLSGKLEERRQQNAFRQLKLQKGKVDFCSNDYLGIVKNNLIAGQLPERENPLRSGSTGSRLLAGNYPLIESVERELAVFHDAPSGLLFNSGYDANLGLLSCVPQRGDTILYDFLSHASLRDGTRLSNARSFSFLHNNLEDLEEKLRSASGNVFVVTESVFSMDGDFAPLTGISALCEKYGAHLVVDEAHATGVVGPRGEGLVQASGLQRLCFARIHTFGKACGVHGAIVLGSDLLRTYLVNFSRPFIYTTALPEPTVAAIRASYKVFPTLATERRHLGDLISMFRKSRLRYNLLASETAVQAVIVPGNDEVKETGAFLQNNQLDVRPVLYPSVPKGRERLRIVMHSFNTFEEVEELIRCLQ